jgi:hypothetical protein
MVDGDAEAVRRTIIAPIELGMLAENDTVVSTKDCLLSVCSPAWAVLRTVEVV